MRTHKIPGTDLTVSTYCAGGALWGTELRGEDMARVLDAFRDAGGNFFDTAHGYAFWLPNGTGASEAAIADYFAKRGGRDQCVIATKGGLNAFKGYRKTDAPLAPYRVRADIDDSLGRLDCDTIDLYWLHRDNTAMSVAEILGTLNDEVKRGRIRYLGASNWTWQRLEEANTYAKQHGLRGFVASQPEWCLAEPNPRGDTTLHFQNQDDNSWSAKHGFPVAPYTPTAGGYFATDGGSGGSRDGGFGNDISRARLERATQLGRELGKTANQIALAYLLNHPFPVIPILGTKKVEHLQDALGALDVKLDEKQIAWLRGE
jgi:aryl-alcohol dehydrogenase-like predicted oxidoreductase